MPLGAICGRMASRMLIALPIAAVLLVSLFIYLRAAGGGRFPWVQFYTKGKEAGFTFREIGLLRRVAVESRAENPTSLFWSLRQLDRSTKDMIIKLRATNREDNAEANAILAKLFELRKRLELELPKYKLGIKSSRDITPRQRVKIMLPGLGPFVSIVVEKLTRYLALSYPEGPEVPEGFSWKGQQIGVHFWRAEDAGYFFQSKVLGDFADQQYPIIHVAHSDNLQRTQKRRSVRVATDCAAELYPLQTIEAANEAKESSRGLRCRLQDLSEGGAALLVGGRAKAGLPVKVQLDLAGKDVVMCGVVKSAVFDGKRNRSVLHMQAVPPSTPMRNRVLVYVYNLFGDREQASGKKVPAKRPG